MRKLPARLESNQIDKEQIAGMLGFVLGMSCGLLLSMGLWCVFYALMSR